MMLLRLWGNDTWHLICFATHLWLGHALYQNQLYLSIPVLTRLKSLLFVHGCLCFVCSMRDRSRFARIVCVMEAVTILLASSIVKLISRILLVLRLLKKVLGKLVYTIRPSIAMSEQYLDIYTANGKLPCDEKVVRWYQSKHIYAVNDIVLQSTTMCLHLIYEITTPHDTLLQVFSSFYV